MGTRSPEPLRLPDPQEIQGILRHGYPYYDRAAYCLFEIGADVAAFKAWLDELMQPLRQGLVQGRPTITTAHLRRELTDFVGCGISIAFTPSGLRTLGLGDDALSTFVPEFQEGMSAPHRQRLLGDIDA